jgi:hypothetical protein
MSEFWNDAAERCVRAFAQGMLAALVIGWKTFAHGGLPWLDSFYIGVGCAVLALLLSLAGHKVGDPLSGSLRGGRAKQEPAAPREWPPTVHTPDEVNPPPGGVDPPHDNDTGTGASPA